MHPRLTELLEYLDACTAQLRTALAQIPESERAWRSRDDVWSAGQVMQHLALVEGRFTQRLLALPDQARNASIGSDPDHSPILPTLNLAAAVNRNERISAPPPTHPEPHVDPAAALAAFDDAHAGLRTAIAATDGIDLGKLSAVHPVFGEMTFYGWVGLAGAHEVRHAMQLDELAEKIVARDRA